MELIPYCYGAATATPEAYHRREVSPSTPLVIPNVTCICHLPKKSTDAPTELHLQIYAPTY